MRHRSTTRGFTIIETLIFLAVSSFVFVAAIGQYSSQQKTVEFNQGVRGLQSQLLSLISEVSSSFPPDISGYKCTADASSPDPLSLVASAAPNDNSDCVFLGRAIAFGGKSECTSAIVDQCSHYVTIPIIARRQYNGGPVEDLNEAMPFAVAACTSTGTPTAADYTNGFPCGVAPVSPHPNLADGGKFAQNVSIAKAFVRSNAAGTAGNSIGGFAFVFNMSNSSVGSTKNKGSVDLVTLGSAFAGNTESQAISDVNRFDTANSSQINPEFGIALCILNSFGKSSVITVGANNSRLDVVVEPSGNSDTVCQ